MSYKSILTIVLDPGAAASQLDAAVAVAQREDAHLDILCLGIDRTQTGYYYGAATAFVTQETIERAQEDAAAVEAAVRARMDGETMRWGTETAVAQIGGLGSLVAARARFCDLVVLPRPYGHKGAQDAEAVIESAMFEGRAPVLVVPDAGLTGVFGQRIVVGWNQSQESLTAVRLALPLLKAAAMVSITVIDPPSVGPERSDPGGALSQMLARHGVKAEVAVLAKTQPRVSDVLMRHARDINADMVVMGAYGHSRFREAILGGATRNILESADLPVFMAH